MEEKIRELERRMSLQPHGTSTHSGTATVTPSHQQSYLAFKEKEEQNNFAKEVDTALRDMEERVFRVINERLEDQHFESSQIKQNINTMERKFSD